jgi:hypothetical protein
MFIESYLQGRCLNDEFQRGSANARLLNNIEEKQLPTRFPYLYNVPRRTDSHAWKLRALCSPLHALFSIFSPNADVALDDLTQFADPRQTPPVRRRVAGNRGRRLLLKCNF